MLLKNPENNSDLRFAARRSRLWCRIRRQEFLRRKNRDLQIATEITRIERQDCRNLRDQHLRDEPGIMYRSPGDTMRGSNPHPFLKYEEILGNHFESPYQILQSPMSRDNRQPETSPCRGRSRRNIPEFDGILYRDDGLMPESLQQPDGFTNRPMVRIGMIK